MKVFISWSGELSHKIALLLKEWLQDVIQSIEPYVSYEDIDKGARWFTDISINLEDSDFGIICLTPENLNAPWILFEAGALSKSIDRSSVCPFLIGFSPTDVVGPLAQFQACTPKKDDMLKLLLTINHELGERALKEPKLLKAFERCWPEFEDALKKARTTITIPEKIPRPTDEMLGEVLQLCRSISQAVQIPVEYRLTPADEDILQKKFAMLALEEIIVRARKEGGKELSGSVEDDLMKLFVAEGSITQTTKKSLKKVARLKGFYLRIREIPKTTKETAD